MARPPDYPGSDSDKLATHRLSLGESTLCIHGDIWGTFRDNGLVANLEEQCSEVLYTAVYYTTLKCRACQYNTMQYNTDYCQPGRAWLWCVVGKQHSLCWNYFNRWTGWTYFYIGWGKPRIRYRIMFMVSWGTVNALLFVGRAMKQAHHNALNCTWQYWTLFNNSL